MSVTMCHPINVLGNIGSLDFTRAFTVYLNVYQQLTTVSFPVNNV